MTTPSVELVMDLTSQGHKISFVTPNDRVELTPEEAAGFISDLSTGIALALLRVTAKPEVSEVKVEEISHQRPNLKSVSVPVQEATAVPAAKRGRGRPRKNPEPELPKLKWRRPEGPGYYVTELPQGAKAEVAGNIKEGWTVVINGQEVNNAPVAKKEMAYALVEDALKKSMSV